MGKESNWVPLRMNKNQSQVVSRKRSPKETKKSKSRGEAGYLGGIYYSKCCLLGEVQNVISSLLSALENPIWVYFSSFESLYLVSDHFSWQSYARNKKGDIWPHLLQYLPETDRQQCFLCFVFFSLIHFIIMENIFSQNKGTTES